MTHLPKTGILSGDWKNSCASYTYGYTPDFCKTNATVDMYFANNLWNYSSDFISRVLYVGESLYTIGASRIQMQSFGTPPTPIAIQKFRLPNYNMPIAIDMPVMVR